MAISIKFSTLCLILLSMINNAASDAIVGPLGYVDFHNISICNPENNPINLEVEVTKDSAGEKNLNLYFFLPFDINKDVISSLSVDMYRDGIWIENLSRQQSDFFSIMNEKIPRIWNQLRLCIKPPIEKADYIPAGEYTLKNFQQPTYDDPMILYGLFRVKLRAFREEQEILCFQAEAKFVPPKP